MTTRKRYEKKYWGRMHWHGNADGSDRICYSSHSGLPEARERRVDSLVRRRMRRDIRKQKVVTGTRYGKSGLQPKLFFNITVDANKFVEAMQRTARMISQMDLNKELYWHQMKGADSLRKIKFNPIARPLYIPTTEEWLDSLGDAHEESEEAREQVRESGQRDHETRVEPAASLGGLEKTAAAERAEGP